MTSPNAMVNYENRVYRGLKRFITEELPSGDRITVIKGQQNRNSLPKPPLVVMQYLYDHAYQTNEHFYTDKSLIIAHHSILTVQLDFYGSEAMPAVTMSRIFETLIHDQYGFECFQKYSLGFLPLYCEAPHNAAFTDQSSQYADRWTVILKIDHAPQVCVKQDFAKSLEVTPYPLPGKESN